MAMIFMVRGAFDLTGTMSLGWEDPLEKEMATHSSTIAWKLPWTEEPGRLQSIGSQRVGHEWVTSLSLSAGKESTCNAEDAGEVGSIPGLGIRPGGGHGNPLQYSCLENSMDGGAWWATVHGVAKSWTRMSDFTFTFFHIAPNIAEYSFLEISLTVRLFLSILLTIPFSLAIKYLLYLQPIFLLNSRPIYL